MSAVLEFECRVPVDGYRIMIFDERKFGDLNIDFDDGSVLEIPANASEDEQHLLRRWGVRVTYGFDPSVEPEVQEILEPQSEKFRSFNLFEEASSPYIDFINTRALIGDVEGPMALANRFGPLSDGPQYADRWTWEIKRMQRTVTAWKKAEQTNDFGPISRAFERILGMHTVEASVGLREDPETGAARLCIRPDTLVDALWTQLAMAIDGSEALRTCVECKRLFTIKAGKGRSDKEYCSDACRMRAYRKRIDH